MNGLIFSLDLDAQGGAAEPARLQDADWIHVDYSENDTLDLLHSLSLPPGVPESLVREDTRPSASVTDDGVLLFLRAINLNPASDPEDMVSLRIWLTPKRIVTVRQRRLMSVQAVRDTLIAGRGPDTVMGIALAIINGIGDRITSFVDEVDERLIDVEAEYLDSADFSLRLPVSQIRREVAIVRRYLSPQKEALNSLLAQTRGSLDEAQAFAFRDQADKVTRTLEDLDLIRERALLLREEMANVSIEQQNQRMYALSIVAAIFLPITFVTGLFGMNVSGLPGIEDPAAFGFVVASMIVLTGAVMGYFRFNRWL